MTSSAFQGVAVETAEPNTSQSSFDLQRLTALKQKLIADLESASRRSRSSRSRERLADFLEHGDDFAVARIRAYKLADDWHEPRRLVLEVCLRATRIGLLDFQWDLLCPLCRGPQESGVSLKDIKTDVHCDTLQDRFHRQLRSVRGIDVSTEPGGETFARVVVSASAVRIGRRTSSRSNSCRPETNVSCCCRSNPATIDCARSSCPDRRTSQSLPEGETSAQVTLSSNGWSRGNVCMSTSSSRSR